MSRADGPTRVSDSPDQPGKPPRRVPRPRDRPRRPRPRPSATRPRTIRPATSSLPGTRRRSIRRPPTGPPSRSIIRAKTNGFAIAALVLGIIWIYWIGSILALVFGYIAKSQIDSSGGEQTGRGMAIAGIVLGWIGVGILLLLILAIVLGAGSVSVV